MMTREPDEGWHDDHWFAAPQAHRASRRGGLGLFLLCIALAAGSVAVTMIPG